MATSGIRGSVGRVLRGTLLLVGIGVFVVGLLAVVVPGVERLLPVAAVVESLGSDYVVVAVVGAAAVILAVFLLAVGTVDGTVQASPQVVESVESAPHPGRGFDRTIDGPAGATTAGAARTRLHDLAVETVMRAEGCTRSIAERRVAEGTWTDDPVAAAYVVGDGDGAVDLLRSVLGIDDRVRRTAAAIGRAAGANGGTDGPHAGVDTDLHVDADDGGSGTRPGAGIETDSAGDP